jgi:DNA-binding transcriptional MerR regulator
MKISANVKSSFAIHEVVVLTGFSKYMLDYLAREDIFRPTLSASSGRGTRRQYSYEDVVLLRALHTICVGKGKIRHLKESLAKFRETFGSIAPGQKLNKLLVVQGDQLCFFEQDSGATELVSGQMTLSFVIDMSAVCQTIADRVDVDPKSRALRLKAAAAHQAEQERQKVWGPIRTRRTS